MHQEKLNVLEADLGSHRGGMALGFTQPGGEFQKASSVQLANKIRTDENVAVRKAVWEVWHASRSLNHSRVLESRPTTTSRGVCFAVGIFGLEFSHMIAAHVVDEHGQNCSTSRADRWLATTGPPDSGSARGGEAV